MCLHPCLFSCPAFFRSPSHTDSVSTPWAAVQPLPVLSISTPSSLQPSSHSTSTHLLRQIPILPEMALHSQERPHSSRCPRTCEDLTWSFSSLCLYHPWCQLSFWTNSGLLPTFLLPFVPLSSFTGISPPLLQHLSYYLENAIFWSM